MNKSAVVPFSFPLHALGMIMERPIFAVPEFTRNTNDYVHCGGGLSISIYRRNVRTGLDVDVTRSKSEVAKK